MTFEQKIQELTGSPEKFRQLMANKQMVSELEDRTQFLPTKSPARQRCWHIINGLPSIPLCSCGKELKWNTKDQVYRRFCSSKCAHNSDIVRDAIKETCLDRYGKTTYLSTDRAKADYKEEMVKRFGVDNPFKSTDVQEQIKETISRKYGVTNVSSLDWIKDRITKTHQIRYNRDRYSQLHIPADVCELKRDRDYLAGLYESGKSVSDIARDLGVGYTQLCVKFNDLGIEIRESSGQHELFTYIKEIYDGSVEVNARVFDNKQEIDVYLPDLRIGFEYDGIYWHSEESSGKKDYHYKKTRAAKEMGINIFHIIDIEWKNKKDICKSRIASLIGKSKRLYARQTQVRELTHNEASEFFNQNHIQGAAAASLVLGLIYNDEIVAAMSFGKSRFNDFGAELIRFCNKTGINVVGAASRLFKHGVRKLSVKTIVSFCDLRWGTGNLYKVLGFTHLRDNSPSYVYTNRYKTLESRMRYQKHKLEKVLPVFDKNLSEWENMKANGYDRYWDCGNSVWLWADVTQSTGHSTED